MGSEPEAAAAAATASPGGAPASRRARGPRARYAGLGYALAVLIAGTNLPTPLYAVYERVFGLSALDVTLLVAVYAGAVTVSLVLFGPLSDAVGYRPVLSAGLAAAMGGAGLLAGASGFGWLLAGRVAQGLAVGACSGALTAGLVLAEPRGRRDRASLAAAAVTTGAVGAGPLLAGALAQFGPAPRVLPYLVEVVLLVPAAAAAGMLPGGFGASGRRWRPRWPSLPASGRREFAAAAAVGFLGWAVAYVVLALVPSYAAAALGGGNLLVDGGAAGSLLLFAAGAQVVFRSWEAARAQRTGLALLVAGLCALFAAGLRGGAPALFAAMALAGAGQGLGFAGAVRTVSEVAPAAGRAGTISLFYVITYVGAGLATVGVGLAAAALPLTAAVQVFAAVFAVACGAALAALPRARRRLPPAPAAALPGPARPGHEAESGRGIGGRAACGGLARAGGR